MTLLELLPAVGSGSLVGFTLGLVGGGGSILATPLLLYVVGVANPHVAIGTSALAVSVNAFANLASHAHKGHVRWRCAAVFAAVGTLGTILGSSLGLVVDGRHLLFLFGLVMVAVGLLMLLPRTAPHGGPRPVDRRMCIATAALALATGAASGFFGIGGGFLIVPALIFATGMPVINAVGPRCSPSAPSGWRPRSTMPAKAWSTGRSPPSSLPAASSAVSSACCSQPASPPTRPRSTASSQRWCSPSPPTSSRAIFRVDEGCEAKQSPLHFPIDCDSAYPYIRACPKSHVPVGVRRSLEWRGNR